jgi:glycosyltransferase involved in cell wall biosynthesis
MSSVIAIIAVMAGVGLFFGLVLAYANKKLAVEMNPLIHVVEDILPKGQCGACGFAGCQAYAEAVVLDKDVAPNLCIPGKKPVAQKVAELTGKAAADVEPRVAFVKCSESVILGSKKYIYSGINPLFYEKIIMKHCGELREICNINPNNFLYVYFGRPGATKGIKYLLDAVPTIRKHIPNSHLVLILANEPSDQYRQISNMIEDPNIRPYVHLVPSVPTTEKLISFLLDANCVVIPSLTEGFGFTTAESCALGIPVVASNTGSIPEVVSGHYILVDPASSESIANGVIRVWHSQYDDWVEPKKFLWELAVAEHENIYRELLS